MTFSSHEELKQMIFLLNNQLEVYKKLEIEREKIQDEEGNQTEARLSEKLAARYTKQPNRPHKPWKFTTNSPIEVKSFDYVTRHQSTDIIHQSTDIIHQSNDVIHQSNHIIHQSIYAYAHILIFKPMNLR